MAEPASAPCRTPTNASQLASLAYLPRRKKWALYSDIAESPDNYFLTSCYPITVQAEDDLELLSDVYTYESYCKFWAAGIYRCAQCKLELYSSESKWEGPCKWPSFRRGINDEALEERVVYPYNKYTVRVAELYCRGCKLFLGHSFEDGKAKGDRHPDARFRH